MALTLKESNAVAGLANALYDFLPGSGSAGWKGHVSFKTMAEKVGVADFWQPGSKTPMITALLERTLTQRRHLFERLILEIVRAAIVYRQKQRKPVTAQEIDTINGLILELGFRFPGLWDPMFRNSLEIDTGQHAKQHVDEAIKQDQLKATEISQRSSQLEGLKAEFLVLHAEQDRHVAGYSLERILNRLFALHGLAPREPFKVVGEQIDGSFDLDHETYLVEAKWEKGPLPESSLLVFRGKIEGKSAYTRGVFIALNGITSEAQEAITRGKQPSFFVMDGYDLTMVLSDDVELIEFLRQRRRLLAEEGLVVVPYPKLWAGSRAR
ncbi:MAG: restriction endonuclease [Planctomycetota bacterium]